jgi:hypothetical protein
MVLGALPVEGFRFNIEYLNAVNLNSFKFASFRASNNTVGYVDLDSVCAAASALFAPCPCFLSLEVSFSAVSCQMRSAI